MNIYNFRTDNVILQGDTHSEDITYQYLQKFIKEDSDYIHLGDVGLGFGNDAYALNNAKSHLSRINTICVKKNIIAYLIRGNHDNPDVWDFPNLSNVILIQNGDVGIFPNGKKVLFICGGVSVDRCRRIQGFDYWKDEVTTYLAHVEKTDFIFSHDCPEYLNHSTGSLPVNFAWAIKQDHKLIDDCLVQRNLVSEIVERCGAKVIFYGHFHNSYQQKISGIYGRCLDINEVFEFDANIDYPTYIPFYEELPTL